MTSWPRGAFYAVATSVASLDDEHLTLGLGLGRIDGRGGWAGAAGGVGMCHVVARRCATNNGCVAASVGEAWHGQE